MNEFW